MPFYEYQTLEPEKSCDLCREPFEIKQSILSDSLVVCSECGNPIKKLLSRIGGVVIAGREANQYSDIKHAQFWRDKNGVKHRVTTADGHTGSATVTKKTVNDAMIKARKRRDAKKGKKMRSKLQENIAIERVKRQQNR